MQKSWGEQSLRFIFSLKKKKLIYCSIHWPRIPSIDVIPSRLLKPQEVKRRRQGRKWKQGRELVKKVHILTFIWRSCSIEISNIPSLRVVVYLEVAAWPKEDGGPFLPCGVGLVLRMVRWSCLPPTLAFLRPLGCRTRHPHHLRCCRMPSFGRTSTRCVPRRRCAMSRSL